MKMRMSKSSIHTYEFCPFRYFLTYVKKLNEPKVYVMERGVNIHDAIYNFLINNKTPPEEYQEQVAFVVATLNKLKPYKILLAEEKLTTEFENIELVGITDLLIQHKDKVILFDYKTGKDRGLQHHRFELALYTFILQQNNINPTHWGIMFVDEKKVYVEPIIGREIQKALGKVYDVYLRVKEKRFAPTKVNCRFCPYKDDCNVFIEMYKNEMGRN